MGKDYVILNIEKEYPGYTGTEKWMIITDLTESEFVGQYPEQYPYWKQAVVVSREVGAEILRFKKNESKHQRRKELPIEEEALAVTDERVSAEFSRLWLKDALMTLSPQQRSRIIKCIVYGYTERDVARQEMVSRAAVHTSIRKGVERIRRYSRANHAETEVCLND